MESNAHSAGLSDFLTFLRESDERYRMAQEDEQQANDETQDILHSLELDKHTYNEQAKLARKLVDVRQRRRVAKETQEATAPIVAWSEANKQVIKALERVLGEVRKAEKRQEHRMYAPRTDVLESD
jgi:hypothetical protein